MQGRNSARYGRQRPPWEGSAPGVVRVHKDGPVSVNGEACMASTMVRLFVSLKEAVAYCWCPTVWSTVLWTQPSSQQMQKEKSSVCVCVGGGGGRRWKFASTYQSRYMEQAANL